MGENENEAWEEEIKKKKIKTLEREKYRPLTNPSVASWCAVVIWVLLEKESRMER